MLFGCCGLFVGSIFGRFFFTWQFFLCWFWASSFFVVFGIIWAAFWQFVGSILLLFGCLFGSCVVVLLLVVGVFLLLFLAVFFGGSVCWLFFV